MDSHTVGRMNGRDAPIRWWLDTVAFYAVLAAYAVVFLGWNLPATLCYWLLPRARSVLVGQYIIMMGFRLLLNLMRLTRLATFDLTALDTLRHEAGLVIAANHPTLIDAVLIASRLPRIVCITKASLWDNPALGAGARLAAYIRNDAPHRLVRQAAASVTGGAQLLIFPEGTRTIRPPVNDFKGGFALMAKQAGIPVQTVLLETTTPYLGKGWGLLRRPRFPLHYRARLGRRLTVEAGAGAFTAALQAYFESELRPS